MIEQIINGLSGTSEELIVFILAVLPISELRGAIPVAVAVYHFSFLKAITIAVIGNLVPVLPILLFFDKLEGLMRRSTLSNRFIEWFIHRAEKRSAMVKELGAIGLMFFVAVPLPVTGAWTGSLVAFLLGLDVRRSFMHISFGVLIAAAVVSLLTHFGILVAQAA
ncbi:MAG: small multi-drug export protein [Candidatus Omnitrophica bacterium]|nr:small multi-drug export protein [Candidatus Omnitrophota bacterium]